MAEGDETTSVVVASEVEDDRTQVGRGLAVVLEASEAAGHPDERLLHHVLRCVAVIDEEAGEAHQRRGMGSVHLGDPRIGIDGIRRGVTS